jgi:hypothetical protein
MNPGGSKFSANTDHPDGMLPLNMLLSKYRYSRDTHIDMSGRIPVSWLPLFCGRGAVCS